MTMKKFISILILIFLSISYSNSQEKELYPFSYGAGIYSKVGSNTVIQPDARKTEIALNLVPDFFVNTYLPYSVDNNIGLFLEMGFNNSQMRTLSVASDEVFTTSVNYFSINPYLFLEGFLFGFSMGIPFSADYGLSEGTALPNDELSATERLNNIFEFRAGYVLPVYKEEYSRLNVTFLVSYAMNGMFKDFSKNDPYLNIMVSEEETITEVFNPRVASINIGISYFFYLK